MFRHLMIRFWKFNFWISVEIKNVFTNFVIRLKEENSKNKSDATFKKLAKEWALNYV